MALQEFVIMVMIFMKVNLLIIIHMELEELSNIMEHITKDIGKKACGTDKANGYLDRHFLGFLLKKARNTFMKQKKEFGKMATLQGIIILKKLLTGTQIKIGTLIKEKEA
jgi:hypothetical protein